MRFWALAAASVLVVIFGSAQATGALWRDENTIGGGTVSSGRLDLRVGPSGSEVKNYTFANTTFGANGIQPGGYSQAPLSIRNNGNVSMKYRLQSTSQTGALNFTLAATKVDTPAGCPATGAPSENPLALYTGNFATAQAPASPGFRDVAPGKAEVLCLRLTLLDTSPMSATSTVKFSFLAQSR